MDQPNVFPAPAVKEPFNFSDFMQFKRMITLQIIPIFYAIVAVLITLGSLAMMFGGGGRRSYSGYGEPGIMSIFSGGGFIAGFVFLIVGNVFWRMWCEFILVLFRINKNIADVEKNTRR